MMNYLIKTPLPYPLSNTPSSVPETTYNKGLLQKVKDGEVQIIMQIHQAVVLPHQIRISQMEEE